jgi:4-hydroxybenzoate polyprenyltransferase/phosphoserine phosphatase
MSESTLKQTNPLYVDLDGTLIYSDCLYESFLRLLRINPFAIFLAFYWLIKGGRQAMKAQIAARVDINVQTLPYNQELIDWLSQEKSRGRDIIMATASHRKYADAIAVHLGLFSRVLASDEKINLKGSNKARILVGEAGDKGFDYAGDSTADLKVWAAAHSGIIVSNSDKLIRSAREITRIDRIFPDIRCAFSFKALRPHQWLKNVLLFVPLLTSHAFLNGNALLTALVAFISFSMCASSVYILNDLLDLEEDRQHHHKRNRPFAAGQASIVGAIITLLVLLVIGFLIAAWVGPDFVVWLGLYYALTLAYSLKLKRVKMIDILVLASLYTIRIVAGAAAVNVQLSGWLLAFSMCFFLSLSLVKRYADLVSLKSAGNRGSIPGRQYHVRDCRLIQWLGLISGSLAVLVLAFYVGSDDALELYTHTGLLWLLVPLIFIWICRIWWAAHENKIYSDPVLFVIKDRFSQFMLSCILLTVVVAV